MKRQLLCFIASCLLLLPASPGAAGTACANPGISCLQQGWKDTDRQVFYHKSQGTRMLYGMPYEWALALEQVDSDKSFLGDDEHIKKFGFLPDNKYDPAGAGDPGNRDKLPVGMTKSANRMEGGKSYLGFTCAACHTGRLHYNNHTLQIDGGTSMQDSVQFTVEALKSLAATYGTTYKDNAKFIRFARTALGKEPSSGELRRLHQAVGQFLLQVKARSNDDRFPTLGHIYPTPWGPSRVDALGRGGNTLFTKLDMDNLRPANAPVSIPYLWGAWNYNWVQWNGSVQIPLARNVAQALLLDAEFRIVPPDRLDSSVQVTAIKELEDNYAAKLRPPSWPEDILGHISMDEARRGKKLFGERCAGCHIPKKESNPGRKPDPWYVMHLIALGDIGTDPLHAFNFYARRAKTGEWKAILGRDTVSVPEAMTDLTTRIIKEQNVTLPADNRMQTPLAYMARPLAGVWATPPFLHNGSVPTLDQLLSPVEERAEEFCVNLGRAEFDPVGVGLTRDACKDAFIFDTTLPGNSNAGHEFRNDDRAGHVYYPDKCKELSEHGTNGILGCALSPADRKAIIEYLKTCDLWRYPDEEWKSHLGDDPVKVCREKKTRNSKEITP